MKGLCSFLYFIEQDLHIINLVPLFCKNCQKTDIIVEVEDEVGLRFISYFSSN